MKVVKNDGVKARIRVTEKEVQHIINKYESWIKQLTNTIDEAFTLSEKIEHLVTFGDNNNELSDLAYDLRYTLERGKELE